MLSWADFLPLLSFLIAFAWSSWSFLRGEQKDAHQAAVAAEALAAAEAKPPTTRSYRVGVRAVNGRGEADAGNCAG